MIKMQKPPFLRRLFMVGMVGLEPMTSCMSSMRSNQLSYTSVSLPEYITIFCTRLSNKKRTVRQIFFCDGRPAHIGGRG